MGGGKTRHGKSEPSEFRVSVKISPGIAEKNPREVVIFWFSGLPFALGLLRGICVNQTGSIVELGVVEVVV